MKKILHYLNPIAHLGETKYSIVFPFVATLLVAVILDVIFVVILNNPTGVGLYAIFIFIALIVYFSFREGIVGGFITAILTILYYIYIIQSRHYQGQQLTSGLETTAALGGLYVVIAWIIGWLKQTIDSLIEREANEKQRLRTILQELPVGVVIADQNGKLVLGNKKIEQIIGRKIKSNVLVGRDTDSNATYHGKPLSPSQWPLAQTLATGKSVPARDIVWTSYDGKKRHLQVSASLIHNRSGKVIAAASIFNDITQLKELEERKDDFVNMASHELKTPITSMKLYIETLRSRLKSTDDRDIIKMINGIKSQSDRLQNLVNDLLDVSRLQTGKLTFTHEEFNLTQLIYQTINELKGTTRKQKIIFVKKTPITIQGDKFRIYQVITNFLTNAIKYSPEGTDILVAVKKEKGRVTVSVKDRGFGIEKDQQKKIFDRLYQVTDSKEKTFPGLGMGLYIAKEIIKKHKGTIWVESEKGKGSTFYFSLPLK